MGVLVIVQERSTLTIVGDNGFPSEADIFAKDSRNGDDQGAKEENSHDNESKDPLESNYFCKELCDTQGSCEYAECKTHRVVLILSMLVIGVSRSLMSLTLKATKKNKP